MLFVQNACVLLHIASYLPPAPYVFPFDRTFVSSTIRKAKTAPVITVGNGTLALWPLAFTFLASPDREFLLVGLYVATVSTDAVSVTSVIRNSSLASVV